MELWLILILLIVGTLRYRLFAADMLQINGSTTTTHSGNLFQEAGWLLQRKQWDQVWELAASHPPPYIMAANIIFCYDSRYPNDHSSHCSSLVQVTVVTLQAQHSRAHSASFWLRLLSAVPHSPCLTRDPSVGPGLLPPHYKISGLVSKVMSEKPPEQILLEIFAVLVSRGENHPGTRPSLMGWYTHQKNTDTPVELNRE